MPLAKNQEINPDLSEREELLVFALCALLILGVFFSKALTTVSLSCLVIYSFKYLSWTQIVSFFSDRTMMPFLLVFLTVFLSGSYSENNEGWQTALRVKLPFLMLPFAIYLLPEVKKVFIIRLHLWLIFTCTITGLLVCFNVLTNFEDMLDLLAKGQPIPTPIEHVKYSMFNAYAAMSGIILLDKGVLLQKTYQWILKSAIILLIILIHLFAVRTGLVILYFSILVYFGLKFSRLGSVKRLVILFTGIICVPVLIYYTVPSIQQKIAYMKYDWSKYAQGEGTDYSDSERIMSYSAGWNIWKSNPILGVGYGDIRDEVHLYYDREYDRSDFFKLPHSQFLLTMAGSGILGLLIFVAGFFTPLISKRKKGLSSILVGYLYLNYSLSFLVENSLERSISVAFFIVFALFLLKPIRASRSI